MRPASAAAPCEPSPEAIVLARVGSPRANSRRVRPSTRRWRASRRWMADSSPSARWPARRRLAMPMPSTCVLSRGETVGPLAGVPVAVKDLISTRHVRTTFGSPLYAANVPDEDDIVVARLRAGRRHRHRQDQHVGIRLRPGRTQQSLPDDAQSMEPGAYAWRIQCRLRGRRCRGHVAAGAGQRWRRVDPYSGVSDRNLRHQALLGARAGLSRLPGRAGARCVRVGSPRAYRSNEPDGRRCRARHVGAVAVRLRRTGIPCPPRPSTGRIWT